MILQYSRNKNLPQALYDLGCDSRDISKDDSIQIHHYNIAMFPENIYAMQSQLEIFNIHYDSGDIEAADTDIQSLIENFSSQPTLPKELYKIAGKYNYAGKRPNANEIYTAATQYSPDDMYVQLSQIFCDITNNDPVSLYTNLTSLIEEHFDDSQLAEEVYNTAVNCGYADQHQYAIQLYQQLLETWPDANQAPYATQRMAIEYSKLGDEANADIAIEKLKYDYGDFPRKAENFWKLGQYYRLDADMYYKASGLYEFGANNSPKEDDHTMFCQIELVKYFIRTGDLDTSDEQYEKLTAEFEENPWLASSICFIGDVYLHAGYIDTAETLYADVLSKWPDEPQSIFALAGLVKVDIQLGRDSDVSETIDEIFNNYADNPHLGEAVIGIGVEYYNKGLEIYKGNVPPGSPENPVLAADRQKSNNILNKSLAIWLKTIEAIEANTLKADDSLTAKFYHYAGTCSRLLGDYDKAVEYYNIVVDNWPEYEAAGGVAGIIPTVYERMRNEGLISGDSADKLIVDAYQQVLDKYPNSPAAKAAAGRIKRYEQKTEQNRPSMRNVPSAGRLHSPEREGGQQ